MFQDSCKLQIVILALLLIAGSALVLYLSWLPDSNFSPSWYASSNLVQLVNEYGRLRTGVPFLFLGFIAHFLARSIGFPRCWIWLSLVVIILVAELGQIRLPGRHFDWADIAFGALGAAIGLSIGSFFGAKGKTPL